MDREQFKSRTKQLALRVIGLVRVLPQDFVAETIGRQLLRSAMSVGANYRAACRAKSPADYINKLKIVEEEGDETIYWLELLLEAEIFSAAKLSELMSETNEIVAMTVASIKTARQKMTSNN